MGTKIQVLVVKEDDHGPMTGGVGQVRWREGSRGSRHMREVGAAIHCGRPGRGKAMEKQDGHGQGVDLAVSRRLGIGQVVQVGS